MLKKKNRYPILNSGEVLNIRKL